MNISKEIERDEHMLLYHGSQEIVREPVYGRGKTYNDYGSGFYCTRHLDLAREWACTEGRSGFVNQYELDMSALTVLNLSSESYTILNWLALLMEYRKVRLSTPVMKRGSQWLREHFLPDITGADVIIGYRADDSYFSFARAFVNNEISLDQLSHAMKLGELGEQYVLKSRRAFEMARFISCECVDSEVYYARRIQRDHMAKKAYHAELEWEDLDGLYMRDMIRGEVSTDDSRLR